MKTHSLPQANVRAQRCCSLANTHMQKWGIFPKLGRANCYKTRHAEWEFTLFAFVSTNPTTSASSGPHYVSTHCQDSLIFDPVNVVNRSQPVYKG